MEPGKRCSVTFYVLVHFLFCRKMLKKSEECTDKYILKTMAEIAREMGMKKIPQVRLTKDNRTGPFTVGVFNNIVFLPDTDYQERKRRCVL